MSQDSFVTLYSKEADEFVTTRFNRRRFTNKEFKLELKKFSKKLRKMVTFKLTKRPHKKK
jgi:ribosomal protein L33